VKLHLHSPSIRTKFLVVGLAAVCAVGLAGFFAIGSVQRLLREQSRVHVLDIAKQAAFIAGPLIAFESHSELRKALDLLRADPDFAYAQVTDTAGKSLATLGPVVTAPCAAGGQPRISNLRGVMHISMPVVDGGVTWGCLQLGTSQDRTERDVGKVKTIAVGAWLLAMLTMVVAGAYLSRSIASPMVRLAKVAGRIGRGEWDATIDVYGQDEVGALADSFRTMVVELRQTTVSKTYVGDILESIPSGKYRWPIARLTPSSITTRAVLSASRFSESHVARTPRPSRLSCDSAHTRSRASTSPVTDVGFRC
jgi:HAMP domain-containing protein